LTKKVINNLNLSHRFAHIAAIQKNIFQQLITRMQTVLQIFYNFADCIEDKEKNNLYQFSWL